MKRQKRFWIKERHNPQLGVYFVACGQMSNAEAKRTEKSLYGDNYMLGFDTEAEYKAKLAELKRSGKSVQ